MSPCILESTRHTPRQGVVKMFRIALMLLAVGCLAHETRAQVLNMDMSWAIQNQMTYWNQGQQAAAQAAQQYLNDVTAFRQATGYTGYIPGPVSQQQLQQSIQGMNQAYERYNQGYYENANRLGAAVGRYAEQAIMGQQQYVDPSTGQSYWQGNAYQHYYVNPQGQVQGNNIQQPPNYYFEWRQLRPVR